MLAWIPLLPLLGFLVNGTIYYFGHSTKKRLSAPVAGSIATGFIFSAFVISVLLFLQLLGTSAGHGGHPAAESVQVLLFRWIELQGFQVDFALNFDRLSSLFCLVITGVGTLIHLYSIGYMSEDEAPGKFFAYLNLFCFSMLLLVLGASFPVVFLGWEGVGLCSYLLIGFWYQDDEKAIAGKKAFVVNRIGDFGFLIGIFILFTIFHSMDFEAIRSQFIAFKQSGELVMYQPLLMWGVLALFLGCTGKSAQIPLYIWLPDAMAGPTPVSALIHAATMVTSGIYLLARLSFLVLACPEAMAVIATIGGLTAFFAATMAVFQRDIKKVLAYSTVSQLGYMFLACGVGAFGAGVFHVITHAFFKALLFLGAGSVIHGMHHEQDIFKMGGLRKYMPATYVTFLLAWLAICGIPPFSGFFSKDEILWFAFGSQYGNPFLWAIGFATALLTAFYMTRLFALTFFGPSRFEDPHYHPHESPVTMVLPLVVLAVLSVVGGLMGVPHLSWLEHWLEPVVAAAPIVVEHHFEWILMGASVFAAIVGVTLGFKLANKIEFDLEFEKKHPRLYGLLFNKWYVDEFYFASVVRPLLRGSTFLWKQIDVAVVDYVVMSLGRFSVLMGTGLRGLQSGSVQNYLLLLFLSVILTLGYFFYGIH